MSFKEKLTKLKADIESLQRQLNNEGCVVRVRETFAENKLALTWAPGSDGAFVLGVGPLESHKGTNPITQVSAEAQLDAYPHLEIFAAKVRSAMKTKVERARL